ncbi:MAG: glycosyltransferase [Frankiaceae bacterium]|nr:glycosyltransferase [Frankiaceae bacterium]
MRVVVVSAWEPWRRDDGAAFVLDHQLRRLSRRHEITLLSAGAPSVTSATNLTSMADLPGVSIEWFGSGTTPMLDYVSRRVWSVRHREPAHVGYVERPGLVAALRTAAADADVVALHGWGTAGLWRAVGEVPTVHVAIDPWTVNADNRRLGLGRQLLELEQRGLIASHERRHYPKLGAVVVVTDPDARSVRALAPRARVEVVPNGVDAGADPANYPTAPVLGFHGVYDSRANVDAARHLVRDLLPRVRRKVPRAEVVLVGRRPPEAVRALVGEGVSLRADVADVRAELFRMAVHVDWMTSGAGIKNKVLEAMAAARPVVATSLAAAGIGDGPGLIVVDDVEQATEAIVGLLSNPTAAAETGRAGRARVIEDFSWEANADRIEALWSELAG